MSLVESPVANGTSVKRLRTVCYEKNWVNSQGVFLGERPLLYSLPLLLSEVIVMFLLSNATHHVLGHLGQPRVVSQIVTGILLGRSVMGRSTKFRRTLFPARGTFLLDIISFFSLMLFLFTIGVKTDLNLIKKPGKRALIIGIAGFVLPFVLSTAFIAALQPHFPPDLGNGTLLFDLSSRLSLASFPVIADALGELRLLNSELGRIVMSGALVTDIISWVLGAASTTYRLAMQSRSPAWPVATVAALALFLLFVIFVARPATKWVAKRTPPGELLDEGPFVWLLLAALASGLLTDMMGYRALLGPFILGLALPGGMPVGATMTERVDSSFLALFLPSFMVLAGFRTDFSELNSLKASGMLELVVILCYVGKLMGSVAASLYLKMPLRDAITVGLMSNIKGIIEISLINDWGDRELLTVEHYSILTVSVMCITAVNMPLIRLLYNPSVRYVSRKRRTIQHAKPNHELRLLACIHNQDQVAGVLDLLESSHATQDSPISLTVLHVSELVGQAASVLRPHKRSHRSSAHPSTSDHIVNAFRYFEQQQSSPGAVSVHPFVAISPYATMYNDVCSLALDRKVNVILLPFHKQSDGASETANHAFRSLNRSVLDFAPCSVAILVDHSLPAGTTCARTNCLLQRVAVYFLGGPDDREALAYASRMAANDSIYLAVIRIVLSANNTPSEPDEEAMQDERMIEEFRDRHGDAERVTYMEKAVEDGEGTAAVVRDMSNKYDLLIVGRRKGLESSPLTSGLSEWSECPELGIIGDMLAVAHFERKVSIMVVQQQQLDRVAGEGGGDGGGSVAGARKRQGGRMMANILNPNNKQPEEVKDVLIHRQP
ncbi:cation/H(+) antiporter 15 [Phoenix dactylifera]|uniref:Cation/H(+) antiporter 15 n=1 Tax=Phoenix dactylifera TaxID=42345 RepID=A0A8B7CIC4_PHODC|nr:cation/H(+) antiporter 15 [Phoenix dactylifera]